MLPPAQRSLTDWVRLLRSEPDPRLYAGDPVRISGFVLPIEGEEPHLARLLVRCCLVDAVPVGLPVRWPPISPGPVLTSGCGWRGDGDRNHRRPPAQCGQSQPCGADPPAPPAA